MDKICSIMFFPPLLCWHPVCFQRCPTHESRLFCNSSSTLFTTTLSKVPREAGSWKIHKQVEFLVIFMARCAYSWSLATHFRHMPYSAKNIFRLWKLDHTLGMSQHLDNYNLQNLFPKISTVNHGKDVAKPRSCQRHQSKQRGLPLWTPSGGRWEEMSAGHCQSHTSAFFPFLWKKVVSTRYAFLLFFSHIYVTRESKSLKKN